MSITAEAAAFHENDPAVVCCLKEAGLIISPADLEDPAIFRDLEDSGLLTIPDNILTIGQVLGAKLAKTVDALSPLTPDVVEGFKSTKGNESDKTKPAPAGGTPVASGSVVRIRIQEAKGIELEFPIIAAMDGIPVSLGSSSVGVSSAVTDSVNEKVEDNILRSLTVREYAVTSVKFGETTSFENGVLTIRETLRQEALKADPLVKKIGMDIVTPDNKHIFANSIMDVVPVATKLEGKLGEGITNSFAGVVLVLTGLDEDGQQVHEFGSCDGFMDEKICYNRPGAPDEHDVMLCLTATLAAGTGMERRGPYAAHKVAEAILQELRETLKKAPAEQAANETVFHDVARQGRPRVVLIKELMGQGAMHDNILLPTEPAGVAGGRSNIDLGNIPVVLSPNEVLDGGVHALTCVGPSSKETTRHYYREPLVRLMAQDEEINLVGVVFVGSSQINVEKSFISGRVGSLVEALGVQGAIVATEGFGNNHIDFAGHIEHIGKRGIPVVGVSYSAYQGALAVGNKYMDAMVELNKSANGMETEVLSENTLTMDDARRALAMLKNKMAGVAINPPAHKWDQSIVEANQSLVNVVK